MGYRVIAAAVLFGAAAGAPSGAAGAVVFEDDFSTDKGWVVSGDATDGMWERGIPVGGGDRGDPPTDFDGSGYAYLTNNEDGNTDVDNGSTYLDSPIFDLSGIDAVVSYAWWYHNNGTGNPDPDAFRSYVSNDAGSTWILVDVDGSAPPASWKTHSFSIGDFVVPTSQVRVRFEAADLTTQNVIEAGVDAFSVVAIPEPSTGMLAFFAAFAFLAARYFLWTRSTLHSSYSNC